MSLSKIPRRRFPNLIGLRVDIALRLLVIGVMGFAPTSGAIQSPATASPSEELSPVAFSPDGTVLASIAHGEADQIALWDTQSGQSRYLPGTTNIKPSGLVFSPDGGIVASATRQGAIQLWDVKSGRLRSTLGGNNDPPVQNLAFSPRGHLLASLTAEGMVKLWDTSTGSLVRNIASDPYGFTSLGFSPDGTILGLGGRKGDLTLWDIRNARIDSTLVVGNGLGVSRLTFSPAGGILATVTEDGRIELVDWQSGVVKRVLDAPQGIVTHIAFTAGGETLASATSGSQVLLWNVSKGDVSSTLEDPSGASISGLLVGPDSDSLLTVGRDFRLRLWSLHSGELREVLVGQQDFVAEAAFIQRNSNQERLISVAQDGQVIGWDVGTGEPLNSFQIPLPHARQPQLRGNNSPVSRSSRR